VGTPLIRHVRYQDFIALVSDGSSDLDTTKKQFDDLIRSMGTLHAHNVLIDLRRATTGPVPEALLVEITGHMREAGLGVKNRVALVYDPDDELRIDRGEVIERIAALMNMHVFACTDYAEALDWLNDPTKGP
jgi:hypothetical protein